MNRTFAHMIGDYILQTHWMATNKTSSNLAASAHVATYLIPFVAMRLPKRSLVIIAGTHFLIDRYRLARYVAWIKNGPDKPLTATGYPSETPDWLAVWLLIITDNIMHVAINEAVP